MIDFLCPNGHRIHCPEDQAGRAATCPRCGVKFRIPDASEAGVPGSSDNDTDASCPELTDSAVSQVPPDGPQTLSEEEPQIEFLCPNGHRLHGRASLQGSPGECPECGSRFRIPTYDDVSDEEATQVEIAVGRADGGGESGISLPLLDEAGQRPDHQRDGPDPGIEPRAAAHPLAGLFCELWAEKLPGATIELHLVGGETLSPDRFAPALSQKNHGVFAVEESGGSHTLTVVAWDSVLRVLVRGLAELPEEMSD